MSCRTGLKRIRRNPLKNHPRLKHLAVLKDLPFVSDGYHFCFGLCQTQYGLDRFGFLLGFSLRRETKLFRALTKFDSFCILHYELCIPLYYTTKNLLYKREL